MVETFRRATVEGCRTDKPAMDVVCTEQNYIVDSQYGQSAVHKVFIHYVFLFKEFIL